MYYKRIEKKDYFYINAPIALEKSYETLKGKKGVIVSSDDNGEFLLVPTPIVGEFVPTTISREDLRTQGFDSDKMTDAQVQDIADEMGNSWVDFGDYWEQMDTCAKNLGFENSDEEEDGE